MRDNPALDRIIGFFEADVLDFYASHPDRYKLDRGSFGGSLETTDGYFYELESSGRLSECIRQIRFGFHSKRDGMLCLGVFLPDLAKAPEKERRKWGPFVVEKSLLSQEDKRFEVWYNRYIRGRDSQIGPKEKLGPIIKKINACCKTLVCQPLYTAVPDQSVYYPTSQNTHAYEDAHQRLYGFLVDSLSKECLMDLANLRNKTIPDAKRMRATTLLQHVFSEFGKHSNLHTILTKVSEQRARGSHGIREAAVTSDAFGDFYCDLEVVVEVYTELLELIESEFSVSSDHELNRHEIMSYLPRIVGGVEAHYSICESTGMVGKTVEKVWYGMREEIKDVHQSEVLYVQYTNGEILAMETGTNALDLLLKYGIDPNELRVDLMLTWVPAPSNKTSS